MTPVRKTVVFSITVIFSVLISFFCHSPYFDPFYNSDLAVHILMSHSLSVPKDLYYWGQDRLGSFLPMLAHFCSKVFGIGALASATFVQYTLLLASGLIFSSFIRNYLVKCAFIFVWFLPLLPFREVLLIGHPDGPQLFILSLAFYVYFNFFNKERKLILLILFGIAGPVSVWISELSTVPIGILSVGFCIQLFYDNYLILRNKYFYFAILLLIYAAGYTFILYAKLFAIKVNEYSVYLAPSDKVLDGLNLLIHDFGETLIFNSSTFWLPLANWLLILAMLMAVFIIINNVITGGYQSFSFINFIKREYIIFGIISVLTFVAIIMSNWVHLMNFSPRYFIIPYSFLMLTIFVVLGSKVEKQSMQMSAFVVVTSLVVGATSISIVFNNMKIRRPRIQELSEFKQLGKACLIGDYWYSYNIASISPGQIYATPHDKAYVRSDTQRDIVMKEDTIYLIANNWLPSFPDSILQFNKVLYRSDYEFKIHEAQVCMYIQK